VASGCFDDSPDRVHNDVWLVDRHDVTGLLSDHQTSSFRQRGLIALQLSPSLVGSLSTGDDEDRDGELSARAPDFRRAIPNVNNLVSRRLVSRCAKTRRLRELPH
jgi:hypothetical protein